MSKLIMLIGLPGAGKSTYAKSIMDSEGRVQYCSSDKVREQLYGDENIQGDTNKVFRVLHNKVKNLLDRGYDVIYDATNVTRKNRRSVIQEVKKYCTTIDAHIVWAPYEGCLSRDAARKRSVGPDVIRKFLYRWQSPNYDEGFDNIELIFNCDIGWNRIKYSNAMLDNMKIPHDNPHHTLDIWEHCAAAECYCYNKWGDQLLVEAAAYHDIGKPFTKGFKSDAEGKIIPVAHYYSHDNVGGYFVYGMYTPQTKQQAIKCSWIVCNHMQPFFGSNYYRELREDYKILLDRVHEADLKAH